MHATGTSSAAEEWRDAFDRKLQDISGQVSDIKRDMVTKAEIIPLQRQVDRAETLATSHEEIVGRGKRVLIYLGSTTLAAAVVSPHAVWIKNVLVHWLVP